jgi:hypothetical protein
MVSFLGIIIFWVYVIYNVILLIFFVVGLRFCLLSQLDCYILVSVIFGIVQFTAVIMPKFFLN